MGAVHFSVDLDLIQTLKGKLPLSVFVETGTFRGDTSASVATLFDTVVTIELAEVLYRAACERFANTPNVTPHHGNSAEILREISARHRKDGVVYWLDAHWCGTVTGGKDDECPLLRELDAIGAIGKDSVILIDDARLFLAPPPLPHDASHWPLMDEVSRCLGALSNAHRLWVINDIIVFAPQGVSEAIIEYSRACGVEAWNPPQVAPAPAPVEVAAAQPTVREVGLNRALLSGHRSEQIFVDQLARLNIDRVLDIGANSGQFAMTLRKFGYQGTIYSVEPQRAAYLELIENAREDVRWVPLSRQGAGAQRETLELNLSANSWSSSFLQVHDNHLRAEQSTRAVGAEQVPVTQSGSLLRPQAMGGIEALKIDVQGFEDKVLDGFATSLGNIRLLMLELSMVECYAGAPDLFTLDRRLTEELGFSRLSLEPSYYDETTGIAQQFDGIYVRPEAPKAAAANVMAPQLAAVVTSVGGSLNRLRSDGVSLGDAWQISCVNSWKNFGVRVASVAEVAPPDGIEWIRTEKRPTLSEILAACPVEQGQSILIVNADIDLSPSFHTVLPHLDSQIVYYGQRIDVQAEPEGAFRILAPYAWGFDYFILPRDFLVEVIEDRILPDSFVIGTPWWDYALPVIAMARGYPLKKLPANAGALHHFHETHYAMQKWQDNGGDFIALAEKLRMEDTGHATALLDDILRKSDDLATRLHDISRVVCLQMP